MTMGFREQVRVSARFVLNVNFCDFRLPLLEAEPQVSLFFYGTPYVYFVERFSRHAELSA